MSIEYKNIVLRLLSGESVSVPFEQKGLYYILRFPTHNFTSNIDKLSGLFDVDDCRCCKSRARKYAGDVGVNGNMFLPSCDAKIFTAISESGTPTVVPVTPDMYGPVSTQYAKYSHWTISTGDIKSTPDALERFNNIKPYLHYMSTRLEKLIDNREIRNIRDECQYLARPDHWSSVLRWLIGVQTYMINRCPNKQFTDLSPTDKMHVLMYALMTGRVDNLVHLDYQQSDNIADFLRIDDSKELRRTMDARSDPATYMQRNLVQILEAKQVHSKHTISLLWKSRDDFDLHVTTPNGAVIYYNNPKQDGCSLDFDANANANRIEITPCENISVYSDPRPYKISVNNYARRSNGDEESGDIPFTIICRSAGHPSVVRTGVWGINQLKGDHVHVADHIFSESDEGDIVMSDKTIARDQANDPEWKSDFGEPTSFVTTSTSILEYKNVDVFSSCQTEMSANNLYSAMMLSRLPTQLPTDMDQLLEFAKHHIIYIMRRDCAPGYLVDIKTTKDVFRRREPVMCCYNVKSQHPREPVENKMGTVRITGEWFGKVVGTKARVDTFVKLRVNSNPVWFISLADTKLPNHTDFPLGGGFYPTHLSSKYHVHRGRWAFMHAHIAPINTNLNPMIGSFLQGGTATFYTNGRKFTVTL